LVVGGAIAYGALRLGTIRGFFAPLFCAFAAVVVGLIAGQPPWRAETIFTPIIKMLVGALVGLGIGYLGMTYMPALAFQAGSLGTIDLRSAVALVPLTAILYGIFVEIDDGGEDKKSKSKS
jgi:hypothetical protein